MKRQLRRMTAFVLALSMLMSLLSANAWATEETVSQNDSMESVLEDYFQMREADLMGQGSSYEVASTLSNQVTQQEHQRRSKIAQTQKSWNIQFLSAKVKFDCLSVTASKSDKNLIEVSVYEWTDFNYDDLANGQGGKDTAGYGTNHTITMKESENSYVIVSDEYDESDLYGMYTCDKSEIITQSEETVVDYPHSTPIVPLATYNVDAAVAYADKYALNYNSAYKNMNSIGGDCANFVSQCLYAGGIPMDSTWHYYSSSNYTVAWTGAISLSNYFSNKGTKVSLTSSNVKSQLKAGNPVFYGVGHVGICVGTNSAGTPIIDAHNNNRYHLAWSSGWNSTIQLAGTSNANPTSLTISGANAPTTLRVGQSYSLYGTISSGSSISYVAAGVQDTNGNWKIKATASPYTTTYSITRLDDYITFGKLAEGKYVYVIEATNTAGTSKRLVAQSFTVGNPHVHSYAQSFEAAHPHHYYERCSCGDWHYLDKYESYYAECNQCNKSNQTISVDPCIVTTIGSSAKINASGYYGTLSYSSDNTSIAQVDSNGYVKGIAKGTAEITVTASGDSTHNPTTAKVFATVYYPSSAVSSYNVTKVSSVVYNDHLYTVYSGTTPNGDNLYWEEARDWCATQGGHLACITSESENTAITNLVSAFNNKCWIGGHDMDAEGNFKWISGEPMNYTNWDDGEPNNMNNIQDYMQIYTSGKWDDNNTSLTTLGFVCESENICNGQHQYDTGNVTKSATCTDTGIKTYTCTRCKATKTEEITATGHKLVDMSATAATCITAGKTAGKKCSVCGTVTEAQKEVAALGHSWNAGAVTKAATCTAKGVKTYTCTRCKTTKTEEITATGHKLVDMSAATATCTTAGKTAGKKCSVCGTVIQEQQEVVALGHSWDSGTVTKQATTTEKGVKTYTCTRCSTTRTEELEKLPVTNCAEITVGSVLARAGAEVTVPVTIQKNTGIAGFSFKVKYDATALTLKEIKAGEVIKSGTFTANRDVVTWFNNSDAMANGTLMDLVFEVNQKVNAGGELAVSVELLNGKSVNLSDENSEGVPAVFNAGKVTIQNRLLGDLTGDDDIAINDVVKLNRAVLGIIELTDAEKQAGDVTGDGEIAINDVVKLNRYVLGLVSTLGSGITTAEATITTQSQATVAIAVGSVNVETGKIVSIPVSITGNTGIAGLALEFDVPNGVTLESITKGELLSDGTFTQNENTASWYHTSNVKENGVLLYLNVKASQTAGSYPIGVTLKDNKTGNLSDENGDSIGVDFTAGNVAVTASKAQLKSNTITASNKTFTANASTALTWSINATVKDKAKLTYKSDNKSITVDSKGKVTVKKGYVGKATITITAAETKNYAKTTKKVTVTVNKAKQPMVVTPTAKNYKLADVKKKAQSFTIKATKAQGKVTYKSNNTKYVTVTSKGKVTVKKGAPKGKYTITVTAAGNSNYNSGSKTVTITVK